MTKTKTVLADLNPHGQETLNQDLDWLSQIVDEVRQGKRTLESFGQYVEQRATKAASKAVLAARYHAIARDIREIPIPTEKI